MPTLGTSIKHRRPLISAPQLHLAELQFRMMALRTLLVGDLLRVGDGLRDLEGGEVVALALEGRGVVGAAGGCCGGFGPDVCCWGVSLFLPWVLVSWFLVHILSLTVWQSSQVISGSLALLARGRRLPHVVQKRRPLKAMLWWDVVV
jgi:hypothetical protein